MNPQPEQCEIDAHSNISNISPSLKRSKSNPELFKKKRKDIGLTKQKSLNTDFSDEVKFSQHFRFQVGHDDIAKATLYLTQTRLLIKGQMVTTKIDLESVIGATIEVSSCCNNFLDSQNSSIGDSNTYCYCLKVHCFVESLEHNIQNLTNLRKELEYVFYHEELLVVQAWRNLILHAANNPNYQQVIKDCKSPRDFPSYERNFLVLINPKSGEKKGNQIWETAKQFLKKAGCDFEEIVTGYAGHAKNYMETCELSKLKQFQGIIAVGGDGLIHEIVNGVMKRPDWTEVRNIPIGILPAGISNGVLASLLLKSNEVFALNHACYLIAKGKTTNVDVTMIERQKQAPVYSISYLLWGILPHADFQSEKYKILGDHTFDLYGALALLRNKKYNARLTITSSRIELPILGEEIEGREWKGIDDSFTYLGINNLACTTFESVLIPTAESQDGFNHLLALKGKDCTRTNLMRTWMEMGASIFEEGKLSKRTGLSYEKIKAFRLEPKAKSDWGYYSIDGEKYEGGKIQGQVLEELFTFFALK